MLFFIILSIILLLSIVLLIFLKKKEDKKDTYKKFKSVLSGTILGSIICLVALTIVVCGIQFAKNNSHESIEKERVYLTYKVENNEYYNTDVVSRIDKFNKTIEKSKKYIKNPWIGCFYTKTHAETEPIVYQIIITDTQNTKTAE